MKESATFITSASITVFLTGFIIITHDLSAGFRESLAELTGNHWISVSIITLILFVFFSWLLLGSKSVRKSLKVYDVSLWSNALTVVTLTLIIGILTTIIARFLME